MSAIKLFAVYLIVIICLLVSLSKIFSTLTVYYNYATEVTTNYYTPYYDKLPSLTFCGAKPQFINDKYYKEKFGPLNDTIHRPFTSEECETIAEDLKQMSLKQQFEVLYSNNDLNELISWKTTNGSDKKSAIDVKEGLNFILSINEEMFCFTIEQDHNHSNEFEFRRERQNPLISFELNFKIPEILVMIHPSYDLIFEMNERKYEMISLDQKITNLFFDKTQMHLLSAPYDTNCNQYSSFNSNHEDSLLNICLVNAWVKNNYDCWPQNYLTSTKDKTKFCSNDKQGQMNDKIKNVLKLCSYRIKKSCYKEYYTFTQNRGFASSVTSDSHVINVLSVNLNKNIVYHPVKVMGDVMMQIMNILCLWMAFIAVYLTASVRIDNTLTKVHSIRI